MSPKVSMTTNIAKRNGLLERLAEGPVICAEGYLFELERRGYVQAGAFVPEMLAQVERVYPQKARYIGRPGLEALIREGIDQGRLDETAKYLEYPRFPSDVAAVRSGA